MYNLESVLENEMHKLFRDFEIQTDHLFSARWPDLVIINKKYRTYWIVDFAVPTDHRIKLRENKLKVKYLDLAVTKRLVQGLEDLEISEQLGTIQTIALLRSAGILRRILETWGDLLSLKLLCETISKSWCEKLEKE